MNDGYCVLLWIREHGHTLTEISETIGYSRPKLSQALSQNRISSRLAERLHRHYHLPLLPTDRPLWAMNQAQHQKGMPSGRRREANSSKLDAHADNISQLLAQGVSQKEIARRYDTAPSNLHEWLKKRGLKRKGPIA